MGIVADTLSKRRSLVWESTCMGTFSAATTVAPSTGDYVAEQ